MLNSFWDTCKGQADHDWPRQKRTMLSRPDRWPQSISSNLMWMSEYFWWGKYCLAICHCALYHLFFSFQICEHLLVPVKVSFQRQTHSSCCSAHWYVKRVILLLHTLFTWLHNAGAKNSFTYLTALLTPDRRKKDGGIRNEEGRHNVCSIVVLKWHER